MRYVLDIWRQKQGDAQGRFERYEVSDIAPELSFLEMLDVLNLQLIGKGEEPIAFDSDCREGICGMCGLVIDGVAHGPLRECATCELHMRHFPDGAHIVVEPWRASMFPVIKDLVVDRSPLDRIMAAGGFISENTGNAPDANTILVPKADAEAAMDAAACIQCGACVAACPNASAALFTAAKIAHLGLLPQGQPERGRRVLAMVARMDREGFGNCTWHGECQAVCPKAISIDTIARMNRDWIRAATRKRPRMRYNPDRERS